MSRPLLAIVFLQLNQSDYLSDGLCAVACEHFLKFHLKSFSNISDRFRFEMIKPYEYGWCSVTFYVAVVAACQYKI